MAEGGKGSTAEEALRSGALRGWRKTVVAATFLCLVCKLKRWLGAAREFVV
jgi:hypothetical protein